ncbi:MAG: LuxR C-terminal-related transcriptional regulator [Mycobacterium sp.]
MLVGRAPEQQRIAQLLAAARLGQSGVLVLRGEAGIGKTALLDDAAAGAGEMAVLRTSGTEHESTLGFAGLHQLLRPALHLIDRIPEPQSDALAVALTLRRGPAPERFAVGAATVSLLSRYAEESPVVVLVDDAHLLDPPSAETLRFAARRMVADPIAMLVCTRPGLDDRYEDAGLPVLDLRGLDLQSSAALIGATSHGPASAERAARLHRATAGNPLALIELSRDIERVDASPSDVPLPVPQTVSRAFGRQISALSELTRLALLVAVIANGDLTVTAKAAAALGTDVHRVGEAEAVGLLALAGGRAEFRHPLVRSAVYSAADPKVRRAVHREVAAALPATAGDRRAWHLYEAAIGPDESVAASLVEVAKRARARGAYSVAAIAFTRSAELATADATRAARLLRAGESAWLAGYVSRADELLRQAAALASDPGAQAEIDALRGIICLRCGSLRDALDLLTAAAARTEKSDADATVQSLADAVTAWFYMCDAAAGLAAAEEIEVLLRGCRTASARVRGQMAIGIARVLAGADGVHWLRTAVAALSEQPSILDDPRRPDWTVIGTLFLRESRVGRDLIGHVVRERRARAAFATLPCLLFYTARDDATTDRWGSALADYDESIALARETGQCTDLAVSLAGLAWLQARMGRPDECRANAAEAIELAQRHHVMLARLWAEYALGDLALGTGDTVTAIDHYEELQKMLRGIGFRDVDLDPGPELTEAQLREGRVRDAQTTARAYLNEAAEKGQPWALARAHRAIGLASADAAERATHLQIALEQHDLSPDLFEMARTRLSFGACLRRDKQRIAARAHLRSALEGFERLGARLWADAAANELEATGERPRRSADAYSAVLTSQEIRIARMLGKGATTKQAAAALFLSPKTVEYHLRHIYQKLGIRSRTELTAAVCEPPST